MIEFRISPALKGNVTIRDMLNTKGSFLLSTEKEYLKNDGFLFSLDNNSHLEQFVFSLSIQNQSVVFQRNETLSILTLEDIPDRVPLSICVTWDYTEVTLICRYGSNTHDEKIATVKTSPIAPPNTLIQWAKKQNLLPLEEYESEEEFRNKVHSCLQSIQDKITESGSYFQFWNTTYKGRRIVKREPKNEIEIHPIIHCMLSDQFLMSSIEIVPEFHSSIGNLDFLFISKLKNQGLAYYCVEFKNAHSDQLEHGIQVQLPAYMKSKNAKYGAYCVLDYRGEYYREPLLEKELYVDLDIKMLKSNNPFADRIRVFIYELSKPISASKKKETDSQR